MFSNSNYLSLLSDFLLAVVAVWRWHLSLGANTWPCAASSELVELRVSVVLVARLGGSLGGGREGTGGGSIVPVWWAVTMVARAFGDGQLGAAATRSLSF